MLYLFYLLVEEISIPNDGWITKNLYNFFFFLINCDSILAINGLGVRIEVFQSSEGKWNLML